MKVLFFPLYSLRSRGGYPAAMASWFLVHMFNDVLAKIAKVALNFDYMKTETVGVAACPALGSSS